MSTAVELLTNEPILVMTFSSDIDAELVSDTYLRALELAHEANGALYWLVDVRGAQSPALIASAIKELVKGLAGAPVMPQINMAFIAQPGIQADTVWTASPAGWFTDYAAALNHARTQIADVLHAR